MHDSGCPSADNLRDLLDISRMRSGTTLAHPFLRMDGVVVTLLVVSSVAISVGLSRLAVGEMFRLTRIDAQRRDPEPPSA